MLNLYNYLISDYLSTPHLELQYLFLIEAQSFHLLVEHKSLHILSKNRKIRNQTIYLKQKVIALLVINCFKPPSQLGDGGGGVPVDL
jgi:hypothetical protein